MSQKQTSYDLLRREMGFPGDGKMRPGTLLVQTSTGCFFTFVRESILDAGLLEVLSHDGRPDTVHVLDLKLVDPASAWKDADDVP